MSKSDFFFVGSPHTPITISGSDPYRTVPATEGNGARLACWYKLDPGMYVTGSENSVGRNRLDTIKDSSGNPNAAGHRSMNRNSDSRPLVTEDKVGQNLQTDAAISDPFETYGQFAMRNHDTGSADNSSEWSSWISGSNSSTVDDKHETSMFAVMQYKSDGDTAERPFNFSYGTAVNGDDGNDRKYSTFTLGLYHDATSPAADTWHRGTSGTKHRGIWFGYCEKDGTSVGRKGLEANLPDTYNCLSLTYTGTSSMNLQVYANGKSDRSFQFNQAPYAGGNNVPGHKGSKKVVAIGGDTRDWGSGMADGVNATSSIGEIFAFDDALTDIRRQQMEKYLCDKYGIAMSSSYFLSQFQGGAEGTILPHSSSYPDPSGSHMAFARKYVQEQDRYFDFDAVHGSSIHYETAAGVWAKNASNSGKLYDTTGSISMRAWVRADNIDLDDETSNCPNHAGSQIALVARATDPYGHQMDNIKGYAAKFGTFANGADTGNLKFRISARDARQYTDGNSSGFGDTDCSLPFTVSTGSWYQMRLDVVRSGSINPARTEYNTTSFTTKTADFSSTSHDASGTIGAKTGWEKLIGTERGLAGAAKYSDMVPYFTDDASRIFVSSGSYWDDNLWNSNDGDMTVQVWIYANGKSGNQYPRAFGWGSYNDYEHALYLGQYGTDNNIGWLVDYNNQRYRYYWDAKLTPYTWNHVVVTSKASADAANYVEPILYLNGTKYDSYSESGTTEVPSNAGTTRRWLNEKFIIGGTNQSNGNDHAGEMALRDVGVWNAIVTDDEAAQLYKSGSITNGYNTLTSRQSLCRAYYELTGAVSAPYFGHYGNDTAELDAGNPSSTYWRNNLASNNGEITIMGWSYFDGNQSSRWNSLMSHGAWSNSGTGHGWYLTYDQDYDRMEVGVNYNGRTISRYGATNSFPANRWVHWACTFKTGTNYGNGWDDTDPILYIDGKAITSTENLQGHSPASNWEYDVSERTTFPFMSSTDSAYCREFGIWNKIFTPAEILAAYNGGEFCDNSTVQNSYCRGYWRMNQVTPGTGYALTDGSGDYMRVAHNLNFPERELASGDNRGKVTFSGWAYSDWTTRSSEQLLMQLGQGSEYYITVASGRVKLQVRYSSTTVVYTWPSSTQLTDNTFNHIAIVSDIGKTFADRVLPILYVNGTSQGNGTESATPGDTETWKDHDGYIHMGTKSGYGHDFAGRSKDFAVWNKLLTSSEITTLYNSGTPSYDVSNMHSDVLAWYWPFTSEMSAAKLNWYIDLFAGDAKIAGITYTDSMSQNNLAATKIHHRENAGSFGMFPDASNSIKTWDATCVTPSVLTPAPKRDAYTIMGWYYPDDTDAIGIITEFGQWKSSSQSSGTYYWDGHSFRVDTNGKLSIVAQDTHSDQDYCISNTAITEGQWNHIAATVYPFTTTKNVEFYINGARAGLSNSDWSAFSRYSWGGVQKVFNTTDTYPEVRVGIGFGEADLPPVREIRGPLSELAIYQGALTHQQISGAYNDGYLTYVSGSVSEGFIDYDLNRIITGSATSHDQVGYWKMGNTSIHQSEAYATVGNLGGFTDHSIGSLRPMLTSSATTSGTKTQSVQEPYQQDASTESIDTIQLWARQDTADQWSLGSEVVISHTGSQAAYRYVSTDIPTAGTVPAHNGRVNGYWVAMSSSNGKRLTTEYYIDNLEIITSGNITP